MTTFRKPDLSAPRYRPKNKMVLTKELYKSFIEKYPQHKNLNYDMFKKIIGEFNGKLQKAVIDNRDGVALPENLGYLLIARCDKAKSENIDFVASVKYGKKVNHLNWDSDNFLAKICYTNYSLKYRFRDRELWSFAPVKQFKTQVAGSFPELYNKYIHLSTSVRLSKLYKNV
ncbi:MAG TPA: hypothetical protein PLG47_05635 [Candidatus Dojkabacteria bacterium]|nr:hypothetical protein [Candidatus Dojkabacteria bacterium]